MHIREDMLWIRLISDNGGKADSGEWVRHGGKWIIFDSRAMIVKLVKDLAPLVDSGVIAGAKYWKKDPSAICVYCLDREKEDIEKVLDRLGAGRKRVWEYDYATKKNICNAATFVYSWYSKFRTILQSYGIAGSIKLARDILQGKGD